MKELLLLCAKNIDFIFWNQVYLQTDGVPIGSPSENILDSTFMVELESTAINTIGLVPQLKQYMKILKPYMNDTIAWFKVDSGEYFMKILNNFNDNIRFTHKEEVKSKLNITFY